MPSVEYIGCGSSLVKGKNLETDHVCVNVYEAGGGGFLAVVDPHHLSVPGYCIYVFWGPGMYPAARL